MPQAKEQKKISKLWEDSQSVGPFTESKNTYWYPPITLKIHFFTILTRLHAKVVRRTNILKWTLRRRSLGLFVQEMVFEGVCKVKGRSQNKWLACASSDVAKLDLAATPHRWDSRVKTSASEIAERNAEILTIHLKSQRPLVHVENQVEDVRARERLGRVFSNDLAVVHEDHPPEVPAPARLVRAKESNVTVAFQRERRQTNTWDGEREGGGGGGLDLRGKSSLY